ncbi:MAG: restriction endonuclease subunit S [Methanobacterium sp.]|jgi:type I restriction enzyme S subunit
MIYKKYPEYKDSELEWIGKIPIQWEIKRIADVYGYRNEKVSDKDFMPLSVTKQGIVSQLENAAKTIHGDDRKRVEISDFVINSRSDRKGSCGVSKYKGSVSLICHVLESRNKNFYGQYSHFLFRSELFSQEFYKWGRGIVDDLWSTRWSEMKKIMIPLPPYKEQEAIANFLFVYTKNIDGLIQKNIEYIDLLKEKRIGLISHVVNKGLNTDVDMKDSGVEWVGKIPNHWKVQKLKYTVKVNQNSLNEKTDPNLELNYLDISNVSRFGKILSTEAILFKNAPSRAKRIPKKNDVIISTVRTYLKAIAYLDKIPNNLIVSTGFAVLEAQKEINPRFLFYIVNSEPFISKVITESKGVAYPAINSTELMDLIIFYPKLEEQIEIANYLDNESLKIVSLIKKVQKQIELLKEYKISLISYTVTGKIDIRGIIPDPQKSL